MVGCLLAGCAVQPTTTSRSPASGESDAVAQVPDSKRLRAATTLPSFVLRIGVEHVPPDGRSAADPPRLEAIGPAPHAPLAQEPEPKPTTLIDRAEQRWRHDLTQVEDPLAREALHFVSDMVESDRNRAQYEVGLPFFDLHDNDPDRGPLLASEEAMQADHEEWVQRHGPSLLRRPLRQLLRRLPIVQQVELEFDEFRGDNVPLSGPYEEARTDHDSMGRVSMRVRGSDMRDPLEVAYVYSGIRLGTSQDTCKFGIDWALTPRLSVELRAHTMYTRNDKGLRVDMSYRATERMSVHVAVGDDMDFLSTSSIYSLFESPMDGSPGLVLYAVHVF